MADMKICSLQSNMLAPGRGHCIWPLAHTLRRRPQISGPAGMPRNGFCYIYIYIYCSAHAYRAAQTFGPILVLPC